MTSPVAPSVLAPYVKKVWSNNTSDRNKGYEAFKFFADGYPGLMFQQSASGLILNGHKKLSTLFLYGQTVKPIEISAFGDYRVVVVHLYPDAIKSIFGIDAYELTDTCVDIASLPAARDASIVERLVNERAESKQISILTSFLSELIADNNSKLDKAIHYAVDQIISKNGACSLSHLQKELGLSERTFQRRFESSVGVPPKLFCRILRFYASLTKLESGEYHRLTDVAFETGYADQSHFIRSFKEFTGMAPGAFQRYFI